MVPGVLQAGDPKDREKSRYSPRQAHSTKKLTAIIGSQIFVALSASVTETKMGD